MEPRIWKAFVWDHAGATFMARIRGNSGAYITQASLTAITCKVFDLDGGAPDTAILTPSIVVASTVFDTLQAAAADLVLWTVDSLGFNFKHAMPATAFPLGQAKGKLSRRYQVEYLFDPAIGEDFPLVFESVARNLRSFAG